MEKINILYYEPTSGFGGSSRCLLGWLKGLDGKKFNPTVAVHFDGPAIQNIKALGIPVVSIPFKPVRALNKSFGFSYLLLFYNFLLCYIPSLIFLYTIGKQKKVDIFHLNAKVTAVIPGILAAKLLELPCICHLHDIKEPVKRERFFGRWIHCFIVLTNKSKELYKKIYRGKRLELIYNGADLKDYEFNRDGKKLKAEFNIAENEKVVGIVGRLVEGKGFSDFIWAAKIINSKFKGAKFMIVGSAPSGNEEYENILRSLVGGLGLTKDTIFTGWRKDVLQIMSLFDVAVHASSTFPEGFPLVCVEAMALRKPLVVTEIPGSSEIVVDNVTGYIVPPANPQRLSEAILKIISDETLANKMGEEGYKKVKKEFNLSITVKKIESLYETLLKEKCFNG